MDLNVEIILYTLIIIISVSLRELEKVCTERALHKLLSQFHIRNSILAKGEPWCRGKVVNLLSEDKEESEGLITAFPAPMLKTLNPTLLFVVLGWRQY